MPAQDNAKVSDLLMASTHQQERRELRYEIPIAIEVSGIDRFGKVFHEDTLTTDVSEWGCGFYIPVEMKVNDIISVHMTDPDETEPIKTESSLFQVVRVVSDERGWLVGAWKMDNENLWGTKLEKMASRHRNAHASDEDNPKRTDRLGGDPGQ